MEPTPGRGGTFFCPFRRFEWLCAWCLVLACQSTKPTETPRAAPSPAPVGSADSKKPAQSQVPVEQELLQVQPTDIEELTWGQDGQTYALATSRGVWLYRMATRALTAVLPTDHVASVSGGGFVGLSEPGRIPTIWNEEGEAVASLPVAAQMDGRERSLLVNRSGVLALLEDQRAKTFTTWDLVQRRVVASFPIQSRGRWQLSESGRFLMDAQEMGFVVQTSTGAKIELQDPLLPGSYFIEPLRGKEGFLIAKEGEYFELLLEPPRTQRIEVSKVLGVTRLLGEGALLAPLQAGLGLYDRAARKMTTVAPGEHDEGVVSDDAEYFVTSRYRDGGGPEYRVRSARDGALAVKSADWKPWAFRPRSRELALGSPEGLMLLDVSSQQKQAMAPSARLLRVKDVAIDERRQLAAVGLEGEELAIISLRSGRLLHSIGDAEGFRWLEDSARLAVMNWNERDQCSLELWEVTNDSKQKQSEVSCNGRLAWQFSPDPGFLMRDSGTTPKIAQSARQFGVAPPDHASAGWVVEQRAFDALDRESDWLSVRVNLKPTGVPVRGPSSPPSDYPPYTQQLLRLRDGGAIRMDGDAHFTWYDARGVTHDLYCAALEKRTATGNGSPGSTLFPENYGDVRFNRRDQLLFSHRQHPAVADFRSGTCREFPAAMVDAATYPRREVTELARDGAWLATISPWGLFILYDLEHASQHQFQLSRAYASQSLAAGADARVVVVSDDRQMYFVDTRSFRWLRLRWLSQGGQLLPLYDSSDGRFDGSEDALKTVLLRVSRAGEPPKLFSLSEYEAHFGAARRDPNLVSGFFAETRATK